MERRSWPWKRKSSSKHSGAPSAAVSANASPANQSSRRHDDHGLSKFLENQAQEATLRYQQAEEKIKILDAKLSAAQTEITEKENHVKQHAKVAEEAVTGWEKAEAETANVKVEFDATVRQKSELEAEVLQLNGALKESIRNLQKAKEEHERKVQDLVVKKNRECERIRSELESRLAEVGHRLLESTAESKVLGATLQDRMRTISELTDARSRAEAEIGVLNVRLDSMDKDNMTLRYEIQVLNKELQIRNEEKDYCKREADAAHKQQQEGCKKIQVLEAECQRLRTLVRRKLPGPAALCQMKQEVDAWGREERRRSLGSRGGYGEPMNGRLSGGSKDFQIHLLTERLLSMEEETKMLREVLAQRNGELQVARSICSEVASPARKPRNADGMKTTVGGETTASCVSASEFSVNDDGVSCADTWASTLITELDQFKKEKGGGSPGILVRDSKFQMMDDFVEMEQLASNALTGQKSEETAKEASNGKVQEKSIPTEEILAEKEKELNAANHLCVEISAKLLATEKECADLKAKNAANEASLIKLQEKLDVMLEVHAGGTSIEKLLEERNMDAGEQAVRDSENCKKHESQAVRSALSANVQKVICLVEALAHAIGVEHEDGNSLPSPSTSAASSELSSSEQSQISTASNWQSNPINTSFEKLTMTSNKLVEGTVDFIDFMGELSAVLNAMTTSLSSDNASEQGRRASAAMRKEVASAYSNDGLKQASTEDTLHVNDMMVKLQRENGTLQTEVKRLKEELSRLKTEKELLHESCEKSNERIQHIQSQMSTAEGLVADLKAKLASSESELSGLTSSKSDLEKRIEEADAAVIELREKLVAVEGQYQAERDQHQALAVKFQELERQINRGPIAAEGLSKGHDSEALNPSAEVSPHKGEEIAVKLAECQRTILALGKQLKVLSSPRDIPEPTSHSRADSASFLDRPTQSWEHDKDPIGLPDTEVRNVYNKDNGDLRWPKVKVQGFEQDTVPWSPPRNLESTITEQHIYPSELRYGRQAEESETSWLYSPERGNHPAAFRRSPMTSPGRYSKKGSYNTTINELSKSVNIPPTSKHASSTFSRFFSRSRN